MENVPMANGWLKCYDGNGDVYYFNTRTDESTWELPRDAIASPVPTKNFTPQVKQVQQSTGFKKQMSSSVDSSPRNVSNTPTSITARTNSNPTPTISSPNNSRLPPGWKECYDDEGSLYYFNFNTGESSWDPPTPVLSAPKFNPVVNKPVQSPTNNSPVTSPTYQTNMATKARSNSASNSPSTTSFRSSPSVSESELSRYFNSLSISPSIVSMLEKQKVDIRNMVSLNEEILKDFGIQSWGERRAVLDAVEQYSAPQQQQPQITSPTTRSQNMPSGVGGGSGGMGGGSGSRGPPPMGRGRGAPPPPSGMGREFDTPSPTSGRGGAEEKKGEGRGEGRGGGEKKEEAKPTEGGGGRGRGRGEEAKKEDEYVKNKMGRQQLNQVRERRAYEEQLAETLNPATCPAEFQMADYEIMKKPNGKVDFVNYKVDVYYAGYTWTINRRMKQFKLIYSSCSSIGAVKSKYPPKNPDEKMQKFDQNFNKKRTQELQEFMTALCENRVAIFGDKRASPEFTRFIAPIQFGDIKGPGFALPFKLQLV